MGVLSRRRAFPLVAYAFAAVMLGTTLPTPLYSLYQHAFGFGTLLVTVVFAVYAVGVIAALLAFGALSDQVGRRAVLLPGVACSALSAVAFIAAHGLPGLFVGRALSGLSAGIFTGTATAAVVDLAPPGRGGPATLVANVCNIGGLGLGPVLAGVLAQLAPLSLRLPYIVDLALLVPAAAGIWAMPEPVARREGAHLRPQRLGVPPEVRATFARAALASFAGFSVFGLFTSVAPSFLGQTLGVHSHVVAGLAPFTAFAASVAAQLGLRRLGAHVALPAGCATLVAGLGLIAGALVAASVALLFAGAAVSGVGQALTFGAGLRELNAQAPEERRGEVESTYFVVSYVGLIIPVIGVGVASALAGLRAAGIGFTIVIALVAVAVLVSIVRRGRADAVAT